MLHFIPNGLKLRGHLGSELQRKSAGILSIEKDDQPGVSVVKVLKVCDGSPLDVPQIQFAWDKKEEMHVYLSEKTKEEKRKMQRKRTYNHGQINNVKPKNIPNNLDLNIEFIQLTCYTGGCQYPTTPTWRG